MLCKVHNWIFLRRFKIVRISQTTRCILISCMHIHANKFSEDFKDHHFFTSDIRNYPITNLLSMEELSRSLGLHGIPYSTYKPQSRPVRNTPHDIDVKELIYNVTDIKISLFHDLRNYFFNYFSIKIINHNKIKHL